MTRTASRIAVLALITSCFGLFANRAPAQPFEDPGFGDPTTLTPSTDTFTPKLPPGLQLNSFPSAPSQPGMPVRPNSWPGGAPTPVPGYGPAATGSPPPPGIYQAATTIPSVIPIKKSAADPPYEPAEILARVGAERVQACEVLPMVNRAINKAVGENPQFAALSPDKKQEAILAAQKTYMPMAIKEMVNTKLLVSELRANADKKQLKENEKKIRDFFNAEYLKQLQKDYGATSVIDLENKLGELGGSIESQRAMFVEQNLAAGWLGQAVSKQDKEPTHDEMVNYYHKHATEWDTPARARWEQITAKWSNYDTRGEAIAALARWGDDVLVRGVPFADVAKKHSQDFAAEDGGVHDWTSKGSLRSTELDAALFSLPVGAMSRIIEDDDGCHIVRVLERDEAKRAPFTEVQTEIKQALHDGGEAQRRKDYLESLRERTPVWTVFDDEFGSASAMR